MSHGLFCGAANQVFADFDAPLVVADTVAPFRLNERNRQKVVTVSTTRMVADAITKIHSGTGSISQLLEFDDECDED